MMNRKYRIILLLIFLFGYLFLGAYLFSTLESSNEKNEKNELAQQIEHFVKASGINGTALQILLLEVKKLYLKGYSVDWEESSWDLPNSFFFSTTVVTTIGTACEDPWIILGLYEKYDQRTGITIVQANPDFKYDEMDRRKRKLCIRNLEGYGHMSPTTSAGRTACIVFALFGIPLNAWLLSELSEVFKFHFRRMAIACSDFLKLHGITSLKIRKYVSWSLLAFAVYTLVVLVPAIIFWHLESDWNFENAHYYCFISLSTIGFGDFVATYGTKNSFRWIYKILTSLYLTIGLAFLAVLFNAIQVREQKRAQSIFSPLAMFRSSKDLENKSQEASVYPQAPTSVGSETTNRERQENVSNKRLPRLASQYESSV